MLRRPGLRSTPVPAAAVAARAERAAARAARVATPRKRKSPDVCAIVTPSVRTGVPDLAVDETAAAQDVPRVAEECSSQAQSPCGDQPDRVHAGRAQEEEVQVQEEEVQVPVDSALPDRDQAEHSCEQSHDAPPQPEHVTAAGDSSGADSDAFSRAADFVPLEAAAGTPDRLQQELETLTAWHQLSGALTAFYGEYNAGNLHNVPAITSHYLQDHASLFEKLQRLYGAPPAVRGCWHVFAADVPLDVTAIQLRDAFAVFGPVARVVVGVGGRSDVAHVEFASMQGVRACVAHGGHVEVRPGVCVGVRSIEVVGSLGCGEPSVPAKFPGDVGAAVATADSELGEQEVSSAAALADQVAAASLAATRATVSGGEPETLDESPPAEVYWREGEKQTYSLYVAPASGVTDEAIARYMSAFGRVVAITRNNRVGLYLYVNMATAEAVEAALAVSRHTLHGISLTVKRGTWVCTDCRSSNFMNRYVCRRCAKPVDPRDRAPGRASGGEHGQGTRDSSERGHGTRDRSERGVSTRDRSERGVSTRDGHGRRSRSHDRKDKDAESRSRDRRDVRHTDGRRQRDGHRGHERSRSRSRSRSPGGGDVPSRARSPEYARHGHSDGRPHQDRQLPNVQVQRYGQFRGPLETEDRPAVQATSPSCDGHGGFRDLAWAPSAPANGQGTRPDCASWTQVGNAQGVFRDARCTAGNVDPHNHYHQWRSADLQGVSAPAARDARHVEAPASEYHWQAPPAHHQPVPAQHRQLSDYGQPPAYQQAPAQRQHLPDYMQPRAQYQAPAPWPLAEHQQVPGGLPMYGQELSGPPTYMRGWTGQHVPYGQPLDARGVCRQMPSTAVACGREAGLRGLAQAAWPDRAARQHAETWPTQWAARGPAAHVGQGAPSAQGQVGRSDGAADRTYR